MPNKRVGFLCGMMNGVHGATVDLAGNPSNSEQPSINGDTAQQYYKCSNTITPTSGWQWAGYMRISYTSIARKTGSSGAPHILSGCSFVSYLCEEDRYKSGNTCAKCATSPNTNKQLYAVSASDRSSGQSFHNNTACNYCSYNEYKTVYNPVPGVSLDMCVDCPGGGESDGVGAITTCCLPSGTKSNDNTGDFEIIDGKCCYS